MIKSCILFILFFSFSISADVLYEFENLEDEKRFYDLIKEVRCPKCTSGSLASSNAPVSEDLKQKIIEFIMPWPLAGAFFAINLRELQEQAQSC